MTATRRELVPTITITSIREIRDTTTVFPPSGPKTETEETRCITADVHDAPTMREPYGLQREWKPAQFGVTYQRRAGRTWEVDTVGLHGFNIKKDGTLGQQRMKERWWGAAKQPQWLIEFVAENMPPEDYSV